MCGCSAGTFAVHVHLVEVGLRFPGERFRCRAWVGRYISDVCHSHIFPPLVVACPYYCARASSLAPPVPAADADTHNLAISVDAVHASSGSKRIADLISHPQDSACRGVVVDRFLAGLFEPVHRHGPAVGAVRGGGERLAVAGRSAVSVIGWRHARPPVGRWSGDEYRVECVRGQTVRPSHGRLLVRW